jgi:hypothetical protein
MCQKFSVKYSQSSADASTFTDICYRDNMRSDVLAYEIPYLTIYTCISRRLEAFVPHLSLHSRYDADLMPSSPSPSAGT